MQNFGDKVVYQIYPRSFQDTNGDGLGDLRGITQRLGYLANLGIDYLWITPFFISPQHDNGYDVADYRSVDPRFGTMEDFEELVQKARSYDITIMLDMVFNHTSTDHEWFQRARAGEKKYQNYYIWRDGKALPDGSIDPKQPPTNWQSKFGGNAWEWSDEVGRWYLHLFDVTQADLNWENPEVIDELADIVRFWQDKGAGGFRFDVVNLISKPDILKDDLEGDGRRFYTDGPRVHEHLKELVQKAGIAGMLTVGEMSSTSIANCIRYSNPSEHELAMTFSFHHLKVDYAGGQKWALKEPDIGALRELFKHWNEDMQDGGGWNAWFWSNHDQPRPISRFADATTYWRESAEMLPTCTHLMRGTPYIYQGEELGMNNPAFATIDQYRDVESLNYYKILIDKGLSSEEALHIIAERSRDDARTPVQWDASETAGFTTGTPWIGIPQDHVSINAAAEIDDPDSVLSYYKKLVRLRHEMPIIQKGSIRVLPADATDPASKDGEDKVICYVRELDGQRLLVCCSFNGNETWPLAWDQTSNTKLKLIGNYDGVSIDNGRLHLRPYEAIALLDRP